MQFKRNTLIVSKKALFIFIGIIAAALIALVIILANQNMISKPARLDFSPDSEYVYTKTGFLYIAGGTVKYSDLSDPSKDYKGSLPKTDMHLAGYMRDTHVVYDESTLCIVGLEDAITPDGTIESVACGDGFVACRISRSDGVYISVYDTSGNQAEEVCPEDTVIKYGFTHAGKEQLYIVTLNTDSSALVSTVTTYDPSARAMTGIITVQDQLIEDIVFTQRSIFISGTSNLIRYDATDNKESYRLTTRGYHMTSYYVKGDVVYFMMRADDGSANSVRMYTASQSTVPSEKVAPFQVPDNTLGVIMHKDKVYAITPSFAYMYTMGGTFRMREPLDFTADAVYDTGDGTFLAASENRLYSLYVTGTNKIMEFFNKQ